MDSGSIREYMSTDFAIITPDMQVDEASAKLIQKAMLGGPVVNENRELVGWISEQECLQVTIQVVYHNQRVANVRDIMRTDVLTVALAVTPLDLARQMLSPIPNQKPKSYPVLDAQRRVIGVITRRHILKMLLSKLAEMSRPG
uniref:CBS domain-containing protein n=1 Tax=Marinobacterium profundum TaxID=1714300 RepID=UPI00082E7C1F|nr:CBS domain-containing protein [Marinobacterium profundum]